MANIEQDLPRAELVVSSTGGGVEVHGAACVSPSKPLAVVGRSEPCELQVRHSKISGKHLQISWQDGRCEMTVMGAMGVFWNDSHLEKDSKVWLDDGDVVVLARRNKQDQSQASGEAICRFQFCLRKPGPGKLNGEDNASARENSGSCIPEPKNSPNVKNSPVPADGKENKAPENVATRTDANSDDPEAKKPDFIENLLNKTYGEIADTEERLKQMGEREEGPKMTTQVKAVPADRGSAAASSSATAAGSGGVPAPMTPPRWKSAEPKDWEKSGSDNWNMNTWRNRASRWDPESPIAGTGVAAPATPGGDRYERARSRTPARGADTMSGGGRYERARSSTPARGADMMSGGDRHERARSRTPARGADMMSGMHTPKRHDSRGQGNFYRDRSSTPARRDRSLPPQRGMPDEVVSAKTCWKVLECIWKVMRVQPAALMSLRTMKVNQAMSIFIQEVEYPNSTGICAPEAASTWHYKSAGALEFEMSEMGLDAELQTQLLQLPEHEVCSALQRAQSEASHPDRWLKGYVKRFWDTQVSSSQAVQNCSLDETGLDLDSRIKNMLSELPEEEAHKAIQKVKQIRDCSNPRAWLVGFCKRYWREVQFQKNWSK